MQNIATLEEDGSIVINSEAQNGTKVIRKYEIKEDQIILVIQCHFLLRRDSISNSDSNLYSFVFQTMTHEQSGQVAKRYFKKVP